jgi:DEAD/DEAH box helicase domain-containing protein
VRGTLRPGAYAVDPGVGKGIRVNQTSARIALLARHRTDVLLVDIAQWPTGLFADPITVEGRAAWYSFAFFLRVAAADVLDVDTLELNAGFRTIPRDGISHGQAFLSDKLENGAGFSRWLGRNENFQEVLRRADLNFAQGIAARWLNLQAEPGPIADAPHGSACDTSCNRCLRDFHNLAYHGLLDWRLALDMAHIARDPSAIIDLSSPEGAHPNVWTALVTMVAGAPPIVTQTMTRLGFTAQATLGILPAFVDPNPRHRKVRILVHPLWAATHPLYVAARHAASTQYPGYEVRGINPFRVLRRPSDCL